MSPAKAVSGDIPSLTKLLKGRGENIDLSIVIALYNEAEVIVELFSALTSVATYLQSIGACVEVILIDDHSTDDTHSRLSELVSASQLNVSLVRLGNNSGQVVALSVGISVARGRYVFVTDGDLQFPLDRCPDFYKEASSGVDLVCAVRTANKVNWQRRTLSWFFARLLRTILGFRLSEVGCNYRVVARPVLEGCRDRYGFVRYSIMQFSQRAKRIAEIPIEIKPRETGHSNYNFLRLSLFYLDIVIDSNRIGVNGFVWSLLAFLAFVVLYLASKLSPAISSSYLTAPALLGLLMVICNMLFLNIHAARRFNEYQMGYGIPFIESVVGSAHEAALAGKEVVHG